MAREEEVMAMLQELAGKADTLEQVDPDTDEQVDPDAERRATVVGWLRGLYGACEDGWLSITRRAGDRLLTDWVLIDDLDAAAQAVIERSASVDVWCGVATRRDRLGDGRRGGDEHCGLIPALWADVDVQDPIHHQATDLPATFDAARSLIAA